MEKMPKTLGIFLTTITHIYTCTFHSNVHIGFGNCQRHFGEPLEPVTLFNESPQRFSPQPQKCYYLRIQTLNQFRIFPSVQKCMKTLEKKKCDSHTGKERPMKSLKE
uniref:Secreted protein n=1 Tax=Globodera rostochiensis TaxID=31243 RepID=A0A914HUD9_GLORO